MLAIFLLSTLVRAVLVPEGTLHVTPSLNPSPRGGTSVGLRPPKLFHDTPHSHMARPGNEICTHLGVN